MAGLLSKLRPLIAWHGTPHDFTKFKFGPEVLRTGEGATMRGDGAYLTGSRDVGENYRVELTRAKARERGGGTPHTVKSYVVGDDVIPQSERLDWAVADIAAMMRQHDIDPRSADGADWLRSEIGARGLYPGDYERAVKYFDAGVKEDVAPGRLLEVAIHADPEELLHWDKPMVEQSRHVADRLMPILEGQRPSRIEARARSADRKFEQIKSGYFHKPQSISRVQKEIEELRQPLPPLDEMQGGTAYKNMGLPAMDQVEGYAKSSARLGEMDIPGLKYEGEAFRRGADGAEGLNYVIWKDILEVLNRYGLPITGAGLATLAAALDQQPETA